MQEKQGLKRTALSGSYQQGFIVKNINTVNLRYICKICSFILRDPFQLTECGHRLCRSCIEIQKEDVIKCPYCQEETHKKNTIPDRAMAREMRYLLVDCLLCPWNGELRMYQDHLDEQHSILICDKCNEEFDSLYSLKVHELSGCNNNISFEFILNSMQKFLDEQYRRVLLYPSHRDSQEPLTKKRKNNETVSGVSDGKNETAMFSSMISDKRITVTVNDSATVQLPKNNQASEVFSNEHSATNDESKCRKNETTSLQNFSQSCIADLGTIKSNIQQLCNLCNELTQNQKDLRHQMTRFEPNPDHREFITYDGILIWKIASFQNKMNAQLQQTIGIDSIPFHTSTAGYKIRIRLYLNGAGDAQNIHMSVFFILMRGEYDATLTFPFTYKVSFCLFDQTSQQRHIIESFRPNAESTSFQRPQSEMNLPNGILRFCPLGVLQQPGNPYVQDDCIFIKVMINTDDIPNVLLAYAFSLESGLSMDVRKAMIRKEKKKRERLRAAAAATNNQNDNELSRATMNTTRSSISAGRRRRSLSLTAGSHGTSPQDGRADNI